MSASAAGRLLLGIDVGTTGAKAILATARGELLAQAGREYPTLYPQPNWAEQDPEVWWRAVCEVLQELLARTEIDPASVAAISVSSQAPSPVLIDGAGRPLHNALLWMDRRSQAECDWMAERLGGEQVAAINGGRIDPYYLAPKLLWLRNHRPDLYSAARCFVVTNGYINLRLTGAATLDRSHGPLTMLFDSEAGEWSPIIVEGLELDASKLPPVYSCDAVVGTVTTAAAAATGLRAGTPVLAGMVDATAAALEAGVVQPGDAMEMTGQSTVVVICSSQPYRGSELIPLGHAVAGRFFVVGATVASGGGLRWFRDHLGETERNQAALGGADAFTRLSAEAEKSPPGSNRLLFLPYLYGERSPIWDSNARGVYMGLSLATTKADMVRALLEGAAFALRHNVERAEAAGFVAPRLACVGGGARSRLWNQIKADILQRPVMLPQAATGAPMGNAILAAVTAGLHPTLEEGVAAMVRVGDAYAPNPANAAIYDDLFAVYLGLYPALRAAFAQLAACGANSILPRSG